jgi:hypothetical protein
VPDSAIKTTRVPSPDFRSVQRAAGNRQTNFNTRTLMDPSWDAMMRARLETYLDPENFKMGQLRAGFRSGVTRSAAGAESRQHKLPSLDLPFSGFNTRSYRQNEADPSRLEPRK